MSSDPRSPESPAASAADGPGAGPVRTCVGCRGLGPRSALLRVVARAGTPAVLVVDTARALPGRGAWLHPHGDCLDAAERRRAFARALRVAGPVDVTAVREHLGARPGTGPSGPPAAMSTVDMGSGSRADGCPMSTHR